MPKVNSAAKETVYFVESEVTDRSAPDGTFVVLELPRSEAQAWKAAREALFDLIQGEELAKASRDRQLSAGQAILDATRLNRSILMLHRDDRRQWFTTTRAISSGDILEKSQVTARPIQKKVRV